MSTAEQGNFVRCPVCTTIFHQSNWNNHVNGASHTSKARQHGMRADVDPEIPEVVSGHRKCTLCNTFVAQNSWNTHLKSATHVAYENTREAARQMEAELLEASGHEGLLLSHKDGVDFGVVDPDAPIRAHHQEVIARVEAGQGPLVFVKGTCYLKTASAPATTFLISTPNNSSNISSSRDFIIKVAFIPPRHQGRWSARLELQFQWTTSGKAFSVIRQATAVITNEEDHHTIAPSQPYQRKPKPRYQVIEATRIVRGIRPKRYNLNPYSVPLHEYLIPDDLRGAFENGPDKVLDVMSRLPAPYQPESLAVNNYVQVMENRLWFEEYQAILDIRYYDMGGEKLTRRVNNRHYYLAIPGLAESRPSVLLGDTIMLQRAQPSDGRWYEGIVHILEQEHVGLLFAPNFQWSPAERYDVKFVFNRYPLRRQHQALHCPFNENRVLFPWPEHVKRVSAVPDNDDLHLYNQLIASNAEQHLAVKTISHLPAGAHAFLVFGPPGTGKTVTIIEAMLQLVRKDDGTKILACAPSNSAADIIAERLLKHLKLDQVLRVYAPSRSPTLSSSIVLKCAYKEGDTFAIPPAPHTMSFRVVVATCVGSAFAHNTSVPAGHFDWIFIDEAGQGTEPELMVPIKGMAGPRTNVILSGDPKQLRPVIRSRIADDYGLGKSLLERLMERLVYDERTGRGTTIIKLLKNFRSHEAILDFPNRTFYRGELQAAATDKVLIRSLEDWKFLPGNNFPVMFHSICGNDEREASSPSYFNRPEASQVKNYVKWLLSTEGIKAEDIGVITPYHAQACKIRELLRNIAPATQVASVELFQGQERKVIIMSTVRSSEELLGFDLQHTLGFVGNPRRFNVAMTRARALLIVVGDPTVLSVDPLWRSWLNFVYLRGGWTGATPGPTWDARAEVREDGAYDRELQELGLQEMRDLTTRIRASNMTGTGVTVDSLDDPHIDDAGIRSWEVDARDAE